MSTLKVTNLQHPSAASANVTLDSSGNAAFSGGITGVTSVNGGQLGARNAIINGAMNVNQRQLGTQTVNSTIYTTDRWQANQTAAGKYSVGNSTTAPSGFTNSFLATSLSAYSVSSTDIFFFQQNIEGYNSSHFGWGTSDAKSVVLSFYVRSSLTGTFGGCLANSAHNRSYPFSYTISSANTWERVSVAIAGDTTGTWLTTTGIGIQVIFGLGGGSTRSGTAGSWQASTLYTATGAVSLVGTSGATLYITGVQLEVSDSGTASDFEHESYGTTLQKCQRYYYQLTPGSGGTIYMVGGVEGATGGALGGVSFPTVMRVNPTATILGTNTTKIYTAATGTDDSITIGGNRCSTTTGSFEFSGLSGATPGQVAVLYNGGSTSGVSFDAEL